MQDNNGRNNGDDVALDIDADDEEDMADNGSEAPLDEVDRDGIPAEPLKTLLVCKLFPLMLRKNVHCLVILHMYEAKDMLVAFRIS